MADVREECYSRFNTNLTSTPGVAEVDRNRDLPLDESEPLPRLNQVDEGHTPLVGQTGQDEFTGRVAVEGMVEVADAAAVGPALNALYAAVVVAVMTDKTLGGYAQTIRQRGMSDPEHVREEGRQGYAAAAFFFEIDFATAEDNPNSLPA